ncbi:MAG: AAA family ATPase [Deltaproteobacteria bacterium]|jgi:hypothetical protein|nr:AAA family ATPase [Deltaproteobacteria bacterium]
MVSQVYTQSQSFRRIRDDNLFYSDKTSYIYQLINDYRTKILCRPFGFGKTLLIDTLEELFSGRRELFTGLWIDSSDHQFVKHPVIRLNLQHVGPLTPATLRERIINDLEKIAQAEALPINQLNPRLPFEDLIIKLYQKYNPRASEPAIEELGPALGQVKVVVLIDDYDDPIVSNLDNEPLALEFQKTLYSFYRSFQNLEKYCRLILLTGQTKLGLGEPGPFSPQVVDISYLPEYAGVCGFIQADLDRLINERFEPETPYLVMKNQAQPTQTADDLRRLISIWYDGYIFDGSTLFDEKNQKTLIKIFNPYSILNFFANKTFDNYWIKAQKNNFLANIVAKMPERFLGNSFSDYSKLALTSVDKHPTGLLLFQAGYLTLKEITASHGLLHYSMKVPNLEVSLGFRSALLEVLFNLTSVEEIRITQNNVQKSLAAHNQVAVEEIFALAVARLTFHPYRQDNFFYRTVFQLFIYCLGFDSDPEDPLTINRLQLVVESFAAQKASQSVLPKSSPQPEP